MRYTRKYAFWLAVVIFLIGLLFYHQANSAPTQNSKELVINAIPLAKQDVVITNEYVGYITPIKSVNLVPNVSGYIDEVFATGGQEVRIGDNLGLNDQREYKAKLDAASASVAQAKADFVNSQSYYNRMKKAGAKAISASALDDAKAKFLAAQGALKQAEASQQQAQVLYDYTVLQAPIDGIVGNVDLTKGNYVAPASAPLLSIIQFDPIRVMFAISDKEYLAERTQHTDGNLFAGEEITIRLSNGQIYSKTGQFQFTDNQVNKTTNSVSIFADFANENKELMANSYVDVLLSKKLKNVFLIRQNYATLTDKGAFVYVIQRGKMKQVPLKIVGYLNNDYVVSNNFSVDEFLVVDKIGRIAPDTTLKMNIVKPTEDK